MTLQTPGQMTTCPWRQPIRLSPGYQCSQLSLFALAPDDPGRAIRSHQPCPSLRPVSSQPAAALAASWRSKKGKAAGEASHDSAFGTMPKRGRNRTARAAWTAQNKAPAAPAQRVRNPDWNGSAAELSCVSYHRQITLLRAACGLLAAGVRIRSQQSPANPARPNAVGLLKSPVMTRHEA